MCIHTRVGGLWCVGTLWDWAWPGPSATLPNHTLSPPSAHHHPIQYPLVRVTSPPYDDPILPTPNFAVLRIPTTCEPHPDMMPPFGSHPNLSTPPTLTSPSTPPHESSHSTEMTSPLVPERERERETKYRLNRNSSDIPPNPTPLRRPALPEFWYCTTQLARPNP